MASDNRLIFGLTDNSARNGSGSDVNPLLHEGPKGKPEAVDDAEVVGDGGARNGLFNLPFVGRESAIINLAC